MNNPFDLDKIREIGVTLSRNKTRTFLTAFGIFWGTAMLAMLWGGADGMKGMLLRHVAGFSTNSGVMFAQRTTMSYKGFNKGMPWNLTDQDVDIIRRITPNIEYLASAVNRGATVKYGSKTSASNMMGVTGDYPMINKPRIYEGRFITDYDVRNSAKVVVLGKNLANNFFGTASPLGKYIDVNGVYFKVVGVVGQLSDANMGPRLDDGVIAPITVARSGYDDPTVVDFMTFTALPGHSPTELRPYIDRAIRANHPLHPQDKNALWFLDISEEFKKAELLFLGISILAIFVGGGTLLAGVIGVGNIMWIVVKERAHEIGIRRALGATPRDIITQILSESIILTIIAGTAGIAFAAIVLGIVEKVTYDPLLGSANFDLPLYRALGIMGVFVVFGALAGLAPSLKAMRIKPVEAINDK